MPAAPRRPCRHPGCNVLGTSAFCEEHTKKKEVVAKKLSRDYDQLRGTRTERGYDNRWLRYSKNYRLNNPLCVMCEKKGIATAAQCVDHIIPHEGDQDLFWDKSNHQSLCNECHSRKTASEDGSFGNMKRKR